MTRRTSTTAADLFVLIDREFRRRRARECTACYVPLPYRVDRSGEEAANWEVMIPDACQWGCDMLLEEIVEDFRQRYDLVGEVRDRIR